MKLERAADSSPAAAPAARPRAIRGFSGGARRRWIIRSAGTRFRYKYDSCRAIWCLCCGVTLVAGLGRLSFGRTWIKVKNPDAPAATRAQDGAF